MSDRALTADDIEHFLARGYVRRRACFSRELAAEWAKRAYQHLGCDDTDPRTWPLGIVRAPASMSVPFEVIAPRAWQAACELVGGAERVRSPCSWSDSFIINFGGEQQFEWQPPSHTLRDWQWWHKDGDFFRHFIDSPEQGLLVVALFSDLEPQGGGTSLACDSVPLVARYLAEHPEGVLPLDIPGNALVTQCRDFTEITGSVGDVLLLHPFLLHSRSVNQSSTPRFMINPALKLQRPLKLSRGLGDPHSPVELAILKGLGTTSYEFVPTTLREGVEGLSSEPPPLRNGLDA